VAATTTVTAPQTATQAAPAATSAVATTDALLSRAAPQLDLKLGNDKEKGLHLSGTVGVVVMMGLLTLLLGQNLAARADDGPAVLQGKPAPAIALKTLDGQALSLADQKGKVVLIDTWATWCPPCRASLPHLDKLYQSVKDKGVNVYAVNVQEEADDVEAFVKKTNLTVPVLLDKDGAVSQAYKASAIPETIIIGKDGKVAKVFIGFGGEETAREMKAAVEKAMK